MRHDPAKLLHDILAAVEELEGFVQSGTRERFLSDRMLQMVAERGLEIIGEALNRLSRTDPDRFSRIENGAKIVGMRNVLAHGYDVIDYRIIWDTLEHDLPPLRMQVRDLLNG